MSKIPKLTRADRKRIKNAGARIATIQKSICGELLGRGVYRDVYVLKFNPEFVVKIERDPGTGQFANVTEWRNYNDFKDWDLLKDWLAPIELISETGQVMIQRRVSLEGKRKKDFPAKIPWPFSDLKYKNFGWLNGRFVCCDYSWFRYPTRKPKEGDLVTAKWWGTIK